MIVIRVFGWFLFFCAALFLVRDVTGSIGTDHGFKPKTVADVWNLVSPGAPQDLQGRIVYKYGHNWAAAFGFFLNIWGSVMFFIPGLMCETFARPYKDKPYKRVSRKKELRSS